LKDSFIAKKLDMAIEEIFGLFLEGCFSSSLQGQLTYFSKKLKILQ
jgi:hypothetical protein